MLVFTRYFSIYDMQLGAYPTPINISYAWSFGSLSGLTIFMQALTGIALDMMYIPSTELVGDCLEAINRESSYGFFMRYMHANLPSMLFAWMYLHQARSLLIGTRAAWAWISGWVLVLLIIIVAFLGYSCVWGQMSYWAATVITSLVTVVPGGSDLLVMLWGGPVIGQATLSRFICLHYLLAIISVALVVVHLLAVHYTGSSNPLATAAVEKAPFMQYYVIKDAISSLLGLLLSSVLVLALPTASMDTELYEPVNTMSTPEHIVPEWYLLPYYAVLRCIPSKTCGCLMAVLLLVQLLLTVFKD